MNEDDYIAGNPHFNGSDLMVVVSGCSGGGKSSLFQALLANYAERRHSFEDAEAEYGGLLDAYQENGYEIVLIPHGTISDRASFLEQQLGY